MTTTTTSSVQTINPYARVSQTQMNDQFINACFEGDLDTIKKLLNPDLNGGKVANIHSFDNSAMIWICTNGHVDILRYLTTEASLQTRLDLHHNNEEGFKLACKNGQIEVVKFMLTDPSLAPDARVQVKNNDNVLQGCKLACQNGQLEIFKFLVTSPVLSEKVNLHAENGVFSRIAKENNQVELIKYITRLKRKPEFKMFKMLGSTIAASVEKGFGIEHAFGPSPVDLRQPKGLVPDMEVQASNYRLAMR